MIYLDNIRPTVTPLDSCKDYFFLTHSGDQYYQVYRQTKKSLETKSMVPPQPSLYRVLISTDARRHLDETKRCKMVKHLSHSAHTSEVYYEYMNSNDATKAHANIKALSTRQRWNQYEIELLTTRWPLSGNHPTMRDIRNFIKDNRNMTRSSKEILAKWQQLYICSQ